MDISEQVVSLELAKKLKELGSKQESYFWWNEYSADNRTILDSFRRPNVYEENVMTYYSAFSVAELGQMLPESIWADHCTFELVIKKFSNDEYCAGYIKDEEYYQPPSYHEKLADALASLFIQVVEDEHGHTIEQWRKQWLLNI